jgi:transposase-like protein
MHVEAMNWSGMGHAEYAAALSLSPHALRIWRDRLEESGNEMDWRSLLHPSARAQLSSDANCAQPKYRLTPEAVDGRSNRRRFSDQQKRAIVQETEKPLVPAWQKFAAAMASPQPTLLHSGLERLSNRLTSRQNTPSSSTNRRKI